MATCFVYTTVVLGQPANLSKQACLYMDATWLSSTVSHRVVAGKLCKKHKVLIQYHYLSAFCLETPLRDKDDGSKLVI